MPPLGNLVLICYFLFGKTIFPKPLHQKFLAVKQFFQKKGPSNDGEPLKSSEHRGFVPEIIIFHPEFLKKNRVNLIKFQQFYKYRALLIKTKSTAEKYILV